MCTVPIFIILIGLLVFVSNATAMPWNNEPTGQTLSTLSADTGVTFATRAAFTSPSAASTR